MSGWWQHAYLWNIFLALMIPFLYSSLSLKLRKQQTMCCLNALSIQVQDISHVAPSFRLDAAWARWRQRRDFQTSGTTRGARDCSMRPCVHRWCGQNVTMTRWTSLRQGSWYCVAFLWYSIHFPFFTLSVALWSLHSADIKKSTNVLSHMHTGPFNKGWCSCHQCHKSIFGAPLTVSDKGWYHAGLTPKHYSVCVWSNMYPSATLWITGVFLIVFGQQGSVMHRGFG